ncbi:MAG: hypothetical protein ACI9JR_002072 [Gammaproteobacteria bacterium]|jgi:hypothetical protein
MNQQSVAGKLFNNAFSATVVAMKNKQFAPVPSIADERWPMPII